MSSAIQQPRLSRPEAQVSATVIGAGLALGYTFSLIALISTAIMASKGRMGWTATYVTGASTGVLMLATCWYLRGERGQRIVTSLWPQDPLLPLVARRRFTPIQPAPTSDQSAPLTQPTPRPAATVTDLNPAVPLTVSEILNPRTEAQKAIPDLNLLDDRLKKIIAKLTKDGPLLIDPAKVAKPDNLTDIKALVPGIKIELYHCQFGTEPGQNIETLEHKAGYTVRSWDQLLDILQTQAAGKQVLIKYQNDDEPQYFLVTGFNRNSISYDWWTWHPGGGNWWTSGYRVEPDETKPMMLVLCSKADDQLPPRADHLE
jgi:hypothetical protein